MIVPLLTLGAFWYLSNMTGRNATPWTRAQLEVSSRAEREGIDNTIPSNLFTRAAGLGVVAGRLEAAGLRVTSGFRSLALTNAIYAAMSKASVDEGGPPVVKPYTGPGAHGDCRALDLGGKPGKDTPGELADLETRVRDLPGVREGFSYALAEGDHLHIVFNGAWLETLAHLNPEWQGNA